jgi:hypothetical protein
MSENVKTVQEELELRRKNKKDIHEWIQEQSGQPADIHEWIKTHRFCFPEFRKTESIYESDQTKRRKRR